MKYIFCFLLGLTFFGSFVGFAQSADSLFLKGNQAYTKSNFSQAIEYYQSVLSSGFESPELYLNLGNAYFREQNYGKSRLYFEKAKKQDPFLAGIDENLELVQSFAVDKITVLPQIAIKNDLIRLLRFYDTLTSFIVVLILSLLSAFLIYRYYGISLNGIIKYSYVTILSLTILIQVGAVTFVFLDYSVKNAIVIEPRVDVKSEPYKTGTTVFTIHSATKVILKNTYENWYFIQLENGNTGWLESKAVEKI